MNLPIIGSRLPRLAARLKDTYLDRRWDVLAHRPGFSYPRVDSLIVPDQQPTDYDHAIAERLLKAYSRAKADETRSSLSRRTDLWSELMRGQSVFFEILNSGDPALLAAYLCNMSRQDATTGVVQGPAEYERIRSSRRYRRFLALLTLDKLLLLAEALGVLPCENPEQGTWGRNYHTDIYGLVEAIASAAGIDIVPPPIDGGLFKIRAGRGLFHERDLNALYTAVALPAWASDPSAAICEIGAGSGRVAYWSHRLGCRSYTTIDLHHVNVVQGYYLLKALPEAKISLYGETWTSPGSPQIAILPYFATSLIAPDSFDIVLNQDSFPEINVEVVEDYLRWIKSVSKRHFFSINHESCPPVQDGIVQLNVPAAVQRVGGFRRVLRVPYWLRKGYVAELYAIEETR